VEKSDSVEVAAGAGVGAFWARAEIVDARNAVSTKSRVAQAGL
jgi:hypothetical protein